MNSEERPPSPGVDNVSIERFPKWGRPKCKTFKKQLLEGAYRPSPALHVEIPKESGGVRLLGVPCVMDRVVMQAIAKVLGQKFNHTLSDFNYGYRPGRSVQQAARKAQEFCRQGYAYQVDLDLKKFSTRSTMTFSWSAWPVR